MYFLCVYSIFKNEAHIFKEWLEHYIREGIEHFYLIDNGSDDNYMDVIKPFMDKITLFHDTEKGAYVQGPIYQRNIYPKFNETEWIICVDLDEFMYAKNGTLADELKKNEYLDVGQIMVPWKLYGSSGHIKQPKSVVNSFLYRKKLTYFTHGKYKTIGRTKAIKDIDGVHWYEHIKEGYRTIKYKDQNEMTEEEQKKLPFQLNHYIIQSWEWFKNNKMSRIVMNSDSAVRDENYFKEWDCNDILDDELSLKTNNSRIPFFLFLVLTILLKFNIFVFGVTFFSMVL